jgi:diacylglycerol kinase (ATP)
MKEREIYPQEIIYSLPQTYAGPLKVYIRKRDITREYKLKIFNSKLKSGVPHVNVIINDNTCVGDIINSAVMLFELEDDDPTGYCIYETNQAKGIYEKMLDVNEKPWASVRQLEIESLRDFTSLRYYLHPKEIMTTTLHLWKMDQSHLLSTDHVFAFITKATTTDGITVNLSDIEIGPIFPKHGMCFINIYNPSLAISVYSSIATSETCRVTALPNIHHEVFDHQQEPILVFINSKSGGRSGGDIINGFSRHLNPLQVFDLSNGGPMPGLYTFRNVPRYRVLACGGDGTVGWVLSSLDVLKDHLTIACPPCGVLPLGTGNDLARALKWGGGYNGEKIIPILFAIEEANCVPFDRWEVNFHNDANDKCVVMNNYLGIGLDAEIALDFHHAREENPEKFNSRFHNKTVYLQLGVQKTLIRDTLADLTANISMTVDGKELNLPVGLKGVVLLNIQSWGAGSEPWGTSSQSEDGFVKNSYDDGILEIMGLSGPMHLGQIKGHIANGLRLAQGKIITISMRETLAVQIDGEAWLQPPSTLTITAIPYKAMMLVKSPHSFHGRGLSHREARSLVHKHSTGAMNSSGISYRRHVSTSPITDSVPPLGSDGTTASCNADGSERNPHMKKGKSTHTLYHRVE